MKKITARKYLEPSSTKTIELDDDDDDHTTADYYADRHITMEAGDAVFVEVDPPSTAAGVWLVRSMGEVLGARAYFTARAKPEELAAVESGDSERLKAVVYK